MIADQITEALERAIGESHSISFLNTSLSSGRTEWRGIDPWMVLHRLDAWYLIGRCHAHDAPRTFRLDRIRAVLPIGTGFQRPEGLDPGEWFATSWGVCRSDEVQEVRILFAAPVAPLIQHALHHPEEEKLARKDGRIEYRARVGPLEEIARWIVGFGGNAVVVEPQQLVNLVREIAHGAAAAHASGAKRTAAKIARVRRRTDARG